MNFQIADFFSFSIDHCDIKSSTAELLNSRVVIPLISLLRSVCTQPSCLGFAQLNFEPRKQIMIINENDNDDRNNFHMFEQFHFIV